jgi:hypothetical protein
VDVATPRKRDSIDSAAPAVLWPCHLCARLPTPPPPSHTDSLQLPVVAAAPAAAAAAATAAPCCRHCRRHHCRCTAAAVAANAAAAAATATTAAAQSIKLIEKLKAADYLTLTNDQRAKLATEAEVVAQLAEALIPGVDPMFEEVRAELLQRVTAHVTA